ncbi:MAG: type III secretion system cytoplasmic ring protein SctQ [Simkaniaceae bacterium]|nr:type III secretion system cytoplasmic ring protein SctQ [Simkaniaceae bacterium]
MDEWTKKIHTLALEAHSIPMWGKIPPFPWSEFNTRLSKGLVLDDLSVSTGISEWRAKEELLAGLGNKTHTLSIELSPLAPPVYLVVPAEDISRISSWLIPEGGFTDPDLQQGFYYYLCLEALHAVDSLQTLKHLSPKIVEVPFQQEEAYCIDLAIACKGMTAWGRLVLTKPFHEALTLHFATHARDLSHYPLAQEIPLTLSIEAGKTKLTQEEFLSLETGDFLILDEIRYLCSLAGTPLFHLSLNDNKAKILQFSPFEKEITMVDDEATLTSPIPNLNPSEVPITLTVEVARLEIPLSHLLTLKPGNVLELGEGKLPLVSIRVQGKCLARGELIQVGEMTGVKITEVGHG